MLKTAFVSGVNTHLASIHGDGTQAALVPSDKDPLPVRRPVGMAGKAVERADLSGLSAGHRDVITQ